MCGHIGLSDTTNMEISLHSLGDNATRSSFSRSASTSDILSMGVAPRGSAPRRKLSGNGYGSMAQAFNGGRDYHRVPVMGALPRSLSPIDARAEGFEALEASEEEEEGRGLGPLPLASGGAGRYSSDGLGGQALNDVSLVDTPKDCAAVFGSGWSIEPPAAPLSAPAGRRGGVHSEDGSGGSYSPPSLLGGSASWPELGDVSGAVAAPSASFTVGSGPGSAPASSRYAARPSESGAVELHFRLCHARQTVSFVEDQIERFCALDRRAMTVWEALALMDEMKEVDTSSDGERFEYCSASPRTHALNVAAALRDAYPGMDWLHLAGLLHGMGRLLAHPGLKGGAGTPLWQLIGESFPVGVKFDEAIASSEYFSANPDRRRRAYNTHLGLYEEGCGLSNLLMSWTGPEYLSIVLRLNEARLPAEALFLLRFRRFAAPLRSRSAYRHVMDEFDEEMLPMLDMFARVCSYQTSAATPPRTAEEEAELCEYMQAVCDKYLPSVLRF